MAVQIRNITMKNVYGIVVKSCALMFSENEVENETLRTRASLLSDINVQRLQHISTYHLITYCDIITYFLMKEIHDIFLHCVDKPTRCNTSYE